MCFRFACSDATIHVQQDDYLRFICPDKFLSSQPHVQPFKLYEKGYILGYNDEEHYHNCNATGQNNYTFLIYNNLFCSDRLVRLNYQAYL